jgi:preprotein translocase subunit YajC
MRHQDSPPVDFSLVQEIVPVLTLVGFALLLWLLLVRPQARRQRELARMQSTLEVGDEVILTSGLLGTVRALDERIAHVEIADGVTIRVARGAVGQVVQEDMSEDESTTPTHPRQAGHVDGEVSEES